MAAVICVFFFLWFLFCFSDIPYSRLPQADGEQEFLNFGELNEFGILNQSNSFDMCDIGSVQAVQTTRINIISPPAKKLITDDTEYHDHHNNQIMYQTTCAQHYEHQMQPNQLVLGQPYAASYPNHHHYTQNYEPMNDDHFYHHPQVYPQQQLQTQIYYHIDSQNGCNDIEYVSMVLSDCVCLVDGGPI